MEEIAIEVLANAPLSSYGHAFYLSPNQRGLSATYSAPIATILKQKM